MRLVFFFFFCFFFARHLESRRLNGFRLGVFPGYFADGLLKAFCQSQLARVMLENFILRQPKYFFDEFKTIELTNEYLYSYCSKS